MVPEMRSENVQSFGIGLQSDDEKIQQQHIINDNRKLVTAIFNRAECWKSGSVLDLDTTDNQGMTLKDRALAEWKGEKGITIVNCLTGVERKSQEEAGNELKRQDLGRNARRKRRKEKRKNRKNEDKVSNTEEAPESLLGDAEKMRRKISLLQVEEQAEKEKVNYALINETKTLLVLAKQFEATDLEKVALEDEMEEIGNAMNLLLRRKSSVSEKQKAVETKVAAIENEQTILKQNMAAQVHESESKIALIQGEIAIAKSSLNKSGCKTKTEEKGGNRDLEKFLEGQILELEGELECPVCLEVAATSPIYKCIDDHLLCRFQNSFCQLN